jgi:glycosyl transferase family 25
MKALVIHAARLKERGEHIDRMLRGIGMDYEFIREGDADALTDDLLDRFLADGPEEMHQKSSRASCTIKHFLAYEKVLNEHLEGALILEDDIVLHSDFMPQFEQSMREYEAHYANQKILISYEDSSLQFVPRSQREKGRMLYPGHKDRMAGAYFINHLAAKTILDCLKQRPSDIPVDCYHYRLLREGVIDYLWCQPALATQGSFTGSFRSSLSKKKDRMIEIRWWFKKNYKRLLYWLR